MVQAEIISLLEQLKVPIPAKEIIKELEVSASAIVNGLSKLLKYGEVKFVEVDRFNAMKFFGSKKKVRLYYSSGIPDSVISRAISTLPYFT